jgi:hypothetical protein
MQIKFSKSVEYVPTFNGNLNLPPEQQIKAKLTVLALGDFMKLAATLQQVSKGKDQIDTASMSVVEMQPLLELAPDFLPRYVELSGLLDADGVPISSANVASYSFFLPLIAELLGQLASISMPNQADVKN